MKNLLTTLLLAAVIPAAWAHDDDAAMKATFRAACAGPTALERHIAAGGDVNAADDDGETALMEAADDGLLQAVNALIKAGADLDVADEDGETALMKAADEGHLAVVQALLSAGANPALRDRKGRSALDHARKEGHQTIVKLLSSYSK